MARDVRGEEVDGLCLPITRICSSHIQGGRYDGQSMVSIWFNNFPNPISIYSDDARKLHEVLGQIIEEWDNG